jgi:predicted ribosome quality control (RQC) complex YloA/Tae2 family protein
MKKTLSSVDLVALVSEFQILVRAKLQQIYHPSKTEFCLHFHIPGKGKQFLRIIAGKMINFASEKRSSLKPSGLAMLLRKNITGAIVEKVWQKDSERIVVFDLVLREKRFHLIVELYSKGNVVLCDEGWKILALQSWQLRKSGAVKMKEDYKFPESRIDWQNISEKDLKRLLMKSEKKNLATSIATDLGLGGLFAEEICIRSRVDSKKQVTELNKKEIKKIFESLKQLKQELTEPKGFVFENAISPVKLVFPGAGKLVEEKNSFSLALDEVNPLVKVSPYEKKILKVENIIKKQIEAIAKIDAEIENNTHKGELIYEHYSEISQLQSTVNLMSKEKGWKEIKQKLESLKRVVSVDLKKKSVVLDLLK